MNPKIKVTHSPRTPCHLRVFCHTQVVRDLAEDGSRAGRVTKNLMWTALAIFALLAAVVVQPTLVQHLQQVWLTKKKSSPRRYTRLKLRK